MRLFHTLFKVLVEDESKFLNYFRMGFFSYEELNLLLMQRQDTNMRNLTKWNVSYNIEVAKWKTVADD